MRHVDDRWCFAFVQSQFQHLFPITSHRHKASRRILPSAFAWFESICTLDFTVWVFQDRKEQLSGVGICYVGMLATFVILCLSLTSKISKVVSVALDSRNIKKPWFRRARHQSSQQRRRFQWGWGVLMLFFTTRMTFKKMKRIPNHST